LGELGIRLNAIQFKVLRDGDRFWYENVYPSTVIKEIKSTTFGDVMRRNTGARWFNVDTFKTKL
jgi:peroxidase